MSVYSKRFFLGNVATGGKTLFTAPAGFVCILHDIEVVNFAGAADALAIGVQSGPANAAVALWEAVPQLGWRQWSGSVPFTEGETLISSSNAGTWTAVLSGYQLIGP